MADTGAPFALPYPEPSDFVRVAPADIQALAEKVLEFLLFTESRTVTANTTLALGDTSKVLRVDSSTSRTVTVPTNAAVPFPIGTVVGIYNSGTADVILQAAGGIIVRNIGNIPQFVEVSLRKRALGEWVVAGL
jgi:hypothetical protein